MMEIMRESVEGEGGVVAAVSAEGTEFEGAEELDH